MSMQTYYDLKKTICKELDEMTYKGKGRIDNIEDLKIIDMLTHSLKSLETVIAMNEAQYGGTSGHYPTMGNWNRSFEDGGMSNHSMGLSNAQRRNAMGQFSRDDRGRSMARSRDEAEMLDGLYGLMNNAKDEETRMKFQRFIIDLEER
jgi:hypothetical protein